MTILVYAANARALWDTIQADIPAIGAKGTSSSNTWRKDDSGRATKIYRAMPTGEHDERAYFVGTVRTGQLLWTCCRAARRSPGRCSAPCTAICQACCWTPIPMPSCR